MKSEKQVMIERARYYFGISFIILFLIAVYVILVQSLGINIECGFKKWFDRECPGCGASRMFMSILAFDFQQAFRYNPFVFCCIPVIAYVFLRQAYEYIRYGRAVRWLIKFMAIFAILFMLFGMLRNTELFGWMAPTQIK